MRKADALLYAGVGLAIAVAVGGSASAQSRGSVSEAQALANHIAEKGYDYSRERVKAWQKKAGISVDGHYGPQTRESLVKAGVPNPPKALFVAAGQPTVAAARRAAAAQQSSTLRVNAPTVEANEAIMAAMQAQKAAVKEPQTSTLQATGNKVSAALRTLAPAVKKPVQGPASAPVTSKTNLALAKQTAPDVAKHIQNKGKKYTVSVVKQFQERAGMKADGLYGPATASALRYFGANAPAPLYKGVNAKYVPPAQA